MPGVLDFVSLKLFFEEVGTFETGSESWDFFFLKSRYSWGFRMQVNMNGQGQ